MLNAYSNLWRIEESFRLMKHYFETRPMFHWTPKRISGHIMLNFKAMIFERYIENQLNKVDVKLSPEGIRKSIKETQKSIIAIGGNRYVSYAKLSPQTHKLLEVMNIKIPKSHLLN